MGWYKRKQQAKERSLRERDLEKLKFTNYEMYKAEVEKKKLDDKLWGIVCNERVDDIEIVTRFEYFEIKEREKNAKKNKDKI